VELFVLVDAPALVIKIRGSLEIQVLEAHAANQPLGQLLVSLQG
jgi:hypothetical protein